MKSQNIDKLYSSLTNHERAALSFKAMCALDEKAHHQVKASEPRAFYSQLDNEYIHRVTVLFEIASLWSIEYWKTYCKMIATNWLSSHELTLKDRDRFEKLDDLHFEHKGRLTALFCLLETLQKEHGVDKQSILAFADISLDCSQASPLVQLNEQAREYHDRWLAFMSSMLNQTKLDQGTTQYFGMSENNHH